jgi:proteic killer suppression protein
MVIRSWRHRGLERLYQGKQSGLPPQSIKKLRRILQWLESIESIDDLYLWPLWKLHRLTNRGPHVYGLSVTPNWRVTFRVDNNQLFEVNYEDYH